MSTGKLFMVGFTIPGLAPAQWTRDLWLRGFGQRSGCEGRFIVGGAEVAAVGVAAFGVIAGQPSGTLHDDRSARRASRCCLAGLHV
jgi:hypothetical protein